jgi:hypothetical protein
MNSNLGLEDSAFELFSDYIEDNPDCDSAYYFRACLFLNSYKVDYNENSGWEINDTQFKQQKFPKEYSFISANDDLKKSKTNNPNIDITEKLNESIFKSLVITLKNFNSAPKCYFEGISEDDEKSFALNLFNLESQKRNYQLLFVLFLDLEQSEQMDLDNYETIDEFFKKKFPEHSKWLTLCFQSCKSLVKNDLKNLGKCLVKGGLTNEDFQIIKTNRNYSVTVKINEQTIDFPLDRDRLNEFVKKYNFHNPVLQVK